MADEKISEYAASGEVQPTDLHDVSVDAGGGNFNTRKSTQYQVTGGENISKVFGDFSDGSTQLDLVVFTLKAGRKLQEFVLKHEAAWGDGAVNITGVTIELGIVGDEGKYTFEPFDVFVAPGGTIFFPEEPNTIEDMDNDVDIVMRVTAVGGNLNTLTSGSIDLFIFTKSMKP